MVCTQLCGMYPAQSLIFWWSDKWSVIAVQAEIWYERNDFGFLCGSSFSHLTLTSIFNNCWIYMFIYINLKKNKEKKKKNEMDMMKGVTTYLSSIISSLTWRPDQNRARAALTPQASFPLTKCFGKNAMVLKCLSPFQFILAESWKREKSSAPPDPQNHRSPMPLNQPLHWILALKSSTPCTSNHQLTNHWLKTSQDSKSTAL